MNKTLDKFTKSPLRPPSRLAPDKQLDDFIKRHKVNSHKCQAYDPELNKQCTRGKSKNGKYCRIHLPRTGISIQRMDKLLSVIVGYKGAREKAVLRIQSIWRGRKIRKAVPYRVFQKWDYSKYINTREYYSQDEIDEIPKIYAMEYIIEEVIQEPSKLTPVVEKSSDAPEEDIKRLLFMDPDELTENSQVVESVPQPPKVRVDYYLFDVRVLCMSFFNFKDFTNPFTRKPFHPGFIEQVRLKVNSLQMNNLWDFEYFSNDNDLAKLSDEKVIDLKAVNLFQRINELGFYFKHEWLMEMSRKRLKKLLCEFYVIWMDRTFMSQTKRETILGCSIRDYCRKYNPSDVCSIGEGESAQETKNKLRDMVISLFGMLVTSAPETGDRKTGAIYAITALVMVTKNKEIKDTFGYLQQAPGYGHGFICEPYSDDENPERLPTEEDLLIPAEVPQNYDEPIQSRKEQSEQVEDTEPEEKNILRFVDSDDEPDIEPNIDPSDGEDELERIPRKRVARTVKDYNEDQENEKLAPQHEPCSYDVDCSDDDDMPNLEKLDINGDTTPDFSTPTISKSNRASSRKNFKLTKKESDNVTDLFSRYRTMIDRVIPETSDRDMLIKIIMNNIEQMSRSEDKTDENEPKTTVSDVEESEPDIEESDIDPGTE